MATNAIAAALLAEAVGSIDPWPGTKWRACPSTRRDELAVTAIIAVSHGRFLTLQLGCKPAVTDLICFN
jgi:hypothetical protein